MQECKLTKKNINKQLHCLFSFGLERCAPQNSKERISVTYDINDIRDEHLANSRKLDFPCSLLALQNLLLILSTHF